MSDDRKLRQHISPAIQGPRIEDLLYVLTHQVNDLSTLAQAVTDQLTITTSSQNYLDKRISEIGLVRPGDVGISDFATKQIAAAITSKKQVREVVDELLKIFYGSEATKANLKSTVAEPYSLALDDTLTFEVDGQSYTYTVQDNVFDDLSNVTAKELASAITRYLLQVRSNGSAAADQFDGTVVLFGGATGTTSRVKVTGGELQNKLLFPAVKNTQAVTPNTQWQVTRTEGATLRFRWSNGSKPDLNTVVAGDRVMMYGQDFKNSGTTGTFTVLASVPSGPAPSLDSGWFEVIDESVQGLQQTLAGEAPITTALPYAIQVSELQQGDLTFFTSSDAKPFNQRRFALSFESGRNKLKVYLPAVTKVVYRNLIGGMHINSGIESDSINGQHTTFKKINDYTLSTPDIRPDSTSTGGEFYWGSWDSTVSYATGDTVSYTIGSVTRNYAAVAPSVNQVPQAVSNATWQIVGSDLDYCTRESGELRFIFLSPHGASNSDQTAVVSNVDEVTDQASILGPYVYDPEANYQLKKEGSTLRQSLDRKQLPISLLIDGELPDEPGILILGLNSEREEEPIRYTSAKRLPGPATVNIQLATQNGTTLTVHTALPHNVVPGEKVTIAGTGFADGTFTVGAHVSNTVFQVTLPSAVGIATTGTVLPIFKGTVTNVILTGNYELKFSHSVQERCDLLSADYAVDPQTDGSDHQPYLTGIAEARVFAQDLIEKIVAAGVYVEFVIVYPSSIGLGGGDRPLTGTQLNDIIYCYGL
jgi:hypothetical protein